MTCPDCQRTTGHDVGCVYPLTEEAMTHEEQIAMLRAALLEQKSWIDNWSPDFTFDDEWPECAVMVNAALEATKPTVPA